MIPISFISKLTVYLSISASAIFVMNTARRKLSLHLDFKNVLKQTDHLLKANNATEALEILEKFLAKVKHPAIRARINQQQGRCLLRHCQTKLAKEPLLQAVTLLKNALNVFDRLSQKDKQAAVLNDLGTASLLWSELEDQQTHLDEALHYLQEGLALVSIKTGPALKAMLHTNLGLVYHHYSQFCPNGQRENLQNAISAFKDALSHSDPKQDRSAYDFNELNLSICYKDLYGLEPTANNLKLALQAAQTSLKLVTPQNNPTQYAQLQFNLGQIYLLQAELEEPARNHSIAFRAFKRALRIFNPEHFSLNYAQVNYELAKIYLYYGTNNNNRNRLQQALYCLGESLNIFDQKDYPSSYVSCHLKRCDAFIKLAELEAPEENLRHALNACEKVSKITTDPLEVTLTNFKTGIIHFRMADHSHPEFNLTRAIEYLDKAFEINRFPSRKVSVEAHSVLGAACHELATLDPSPDNLQQAANSYNRLAHVAKMANDQETLAHSQAELGNVLRNLALMQEPQTNLQASITALEVALEIYRQLNQAEQLAHTATNLGRSYLELARWENTVAFLDKALPLFREAEKIFADPQQTLEQAQVKMEQGLAYQLLAGQQEKTINLTKAVQAFQAALKVLTAADHPVEYAQIQNSLGLIYRDSAEFTEPEFNLTKAARAFEKALEYLPAQNTDTIAQTQVDCGKTLLNLSEFGNGQTNLPKAIKLFEAALKYYKRIRAIITYGTILNHLGVCYQRLFEATMSNKTEYLKLAIEKLEEAVKLFPSGKYPEEYAMTQNNLGTAYGLLAALSSPKVNINKALQAFDMALQVFTTAANPKEHQKVKTNIEKLKTRFNLK